MVSSKFSSRNLISKPKLSNADSFLMCLKLYLIFFNFFYIVIAKNIVIDFFIVVIILFNKISRLSLIFPLFNIRSRLSIITHKSCNQESK